jgi:regulator of protease activity HflC (stomatin/prohibitin superfamily)
MKQQTGENVTLVLAVVFAIAMFLALAFFGLPLWNVWRAGLSGEASLKQAQQTKQILITQAEAEKEAATYRAQAIEIVGRMAKQYPEYRQQEFIGAFAEALHNGNVSQIIYVPTETGIPLLEAGKRGAQ